MAFSTRTVSAIAAAALALTVGISTVAGQTTQSAEQQPAGEGRRPGFRVGRGGPGGPDHFLLPLRQLDLTVEQRAQIKEVLQAARPSADQAPVRKLMELRQSLRAAVLADAPDQTQIDQVRAAVAEAEAAALSKRIEVAQKIAQILTPEQREKARTATSGRGRSRTH
jgi:Spy/CpxP family protein refolding chaperone